MKKVTTLIILFAMSLIMNAQIVEHTYLTNDLRVNVNGIWSKLEFENCIQSAETGSPMLPWQSVALLLPQGTKAKSMNVEFSDFEEYEGFFRLTPFQPFQPNDAELAKTTVNESAYSSKTTYPSKNQRDVTTQYVNGFAIAVGAFTPVKYIPAEGKVFVAKNARVTVEIEQNTSDVAAVSSRPEVKRKVKSLVQNPEMADSYSAGSKSNDGYELLVITAADYVQNFEDYTEFYNERDIRTRVVSTDSIYNTTQGVDNQEKIRNYIKNEYQQNDIMMVLLGGDVSIIPYRGLKGIINNITDTLVDNNIPADIYYAGLDGTWNDNGNSVWGEDGEDDLMPEIGIARMPFNDITELNNILYKSIHYQKTPVLEQQDKVTLVGDKIGDFEEIFGSQFLELLVGEHNDNGYNTIGIDTSSNLFWDTYEELGSNIDYNLKHAINQGTNIVFHVGHAGVNYFLWNPWGVCKIGEQSKSVKYWRISYIKPEIFSNDGDNQCFNIFYSHGCDCGSFEQESILEKMVTIETFSLAAVGNSRKGLYNATTENPTEHLNREFVDAIYGEKIPYIGMALTESKCQTALWSAADESGAYKYSILCLNILGDVATSVWTDDPFKANIDFEAALVAGTMSTELTVKHSGEPLKNCRCSVYRGNDIIGQGVTDQNGHTVIDFSTPVDTLSNLELYVNGLNMYPARKTIFCIGNDEAFVKAHELYLNDENGNGILETGESASFDISVKNFGVAEANDVKLTFFTADNNVVIVNDEIICNEISGMEELVFENAFSLIVNDDVINKDKVELRVAAEYDGNTVLNTYYYTINAPALEFGSVTIEDANGDGIVEPGESAVLLIDVKNVGDYVASQSMLELECDNDGIILDSDILDLGDIEAKQNMTVEIPFESSENMEGGTYARIDFTASSGKYNTITKLTFCVGYVNDGFETGDLSALAWKTSGDSNWFVTDEKAHEGVFSARSGVIGDDAVSSLIINVNTTVEGMLSFAMKTSTEYKRDYLAFLIDNKIKKMWSGDVDWDTVCYTLSKGKHTLEWRYDKNSSLSAGDDAVYIDDVRLPFKTSVLTTTNEVSESKPILMYPNPATNSVNLDISPNVKVRSINVYDITGRTLNTQSSGFETVDISNFSPGVYIMEISLENGKVFEEKIVKK